MVPWLAKCDQELTFINGVTFDTPDEQEKFMGEWITKRTNLTPKYKVAWYSGASAHLCMRFLCGPADLRVTGYTTHLAILIPGGSALHFKQYADPNAQDKGEMVDVNTAWNAGRYDRTLLGIFQVGNLTSVVEEAGAEVVILEEPEHLTWYHHGPRWTEKFSHVVSTTPPHITGTAPSRVCTWLLLQPLQDLAAAV